MSDVRLLTARDVPAAMVLKDAARWNQSEADWRNVFCLAPVGCFGIDCDGALAATATAVCYASDLAWIGMVLTHPDYRGRGFARALMERAIDYLERRGVAWIKLDATDMGRPLYAKLGFEDECPVERWGRPPAPCDAPALPPSAPLPYDLDAHAFGADRARLLDVLAPFGCLSESRGYAMGRPGTRAAYFGPCVTESEDAARDMLRWFLSSHPGETVYWDLLPGNVAALRLAREFGFERLRSLVRMVRPGRPDPPPFTHHDASVFAIAGFEYG